MELAERGHRQYTDPNHHIHRNGGENGDWWIAYVIFPDPLTKRRIRHSLGTKDVEEARRKRDAIFEKWSTPAGRELMACKLRRSHFQPCRGQVAQRRRHAGLGRLPYKRIQGARHVPRVTFASVLGVV